MIDVSQIAENIEPSGNTAEDIFRFVAEFIKRNRFAPYLTEMCDGLDIIQAKTTTKTSKSLIASTLAKLESHGRIIIVRDRTGKHQPGRILLNESNPRGIS